MRALALALLAPACGGEPERCGSGSWRPGTLELHHLAIGQADATLMVGPDGRSLLVDAGESHPDSSAGAAAVGEAIRRVLGCRRLDGALVTHFHLDHVGAVGRGGLWHLVEQQGFQVGTLYHRDLGRFAGEPAATLSAWRAWLAGEGSRRFGRRVVVTPGLAIDLGPRVALAVVAADGAGALLPEMTSDSARSAPPSENDYSVALALRFGRLDYFLGGDLSGEHLLRGAVSYHDIETVVARGLPDMDIYRVNHHGSEHSSNATFLGQIDPQVAIVSAGAGNPHGHPHPRALRRLLATAAVHQTDRGRDIVVQSQDGDHYRVDGQGHRAEDPARTDADGDGYFREVDPDDSRGDVGPAPFGGCDPAFQRCAHAGPAP